MPPARKFIKKIKDKRLKKKLEEAVLEIQKNPTCGTAKKGDLQGIYGFDVYYNKTNYEISYTIEVIDEEIIVVIMVGTRENFYEEIKRYLKS